MSDEIRPGASFGPLAFSGDTIIIGEVLGSGVSGQVYACTRHGATGGFAVKVVDLQRVSQQDSTALDRLETEIRVLREATHPRLLGLYDIYRSPRWLFLVMDRLSGGDLFTPLAAKKRLNEIEARHIFRQVCEALSFLHSKHIIHRDVKPENILIASSVEAPAPQSGTLHEVKLADFGLSKCLGGTGQATRSMVGTPQYWAPEVVKAGGEGGYDARVDLWSLGVLLYVMLRGQYPFKAGGNTQILAGTFDLSGGNWPEASEEAKDLIRKLLRVDPGERLSLEECFAHPWLTGRPASASTTANEPPSGEQVQHLPRSLAPEQQLVKWEGQSSVQVGISDDPAFSLRELLHMQISLTVSMEMANLVVRDSHPQIAAKIRSALKRVKDLGVHTLKLMGHYEGVARHVREQILPEVDLAVKEAVPSMAVEFLEHIPTRLEELKSDEKELVDSFVLLSQELHDLIELAQQERVIVSSGSSMAEGGLCRPPASQCRALPGLMAEISEGKVEQTVTAKLLDKLQSFNADSTAGSSSATHTPLTSDGYEKQDFVDLLLSGAGVVPQAVSGAPERVAADRQREGNCSVEELQVELAEERRKRLCCDAGNVATARPNAAHPLLRALDHLRRVSEILQKCILFWNHYRGTIQELMRSKEHVQTLVKYASQSKALMQRFEQRMAEHVTFWGSIMTLCQQYCKEFQPALLKADRFINQVESDADHGVAGVDVQMD